MAPSGAKSPLLAGRITGAYGIKGWVKVHAFTNPVSNFLELDGWFSLRQGRQEPLSFLQGKVQGKGLIAQLAGVDDRTTAEDLRGTEVWVPASALPELEPGDYYWAELVGLVVYTRGAGLVSSPEIAVNPHSSTGEGALVNLGSVAELLETGANDVLVLQATDDSIDQRNRLVPFTDAVICEVNLSEQRIIVDWHPDD
ncbi:MAG: ribosome maturation factor RimM [Pseudomonadota bacterium]